jgi:hypothetical protein
MAMTAIGATARTRPGEEPAVEALPLLQPVASAEPAAAAQPGFDVRLGDSLPGIGERLVSNAAVLSNPAWAPPVNLPEALDRARTAPEFPEPAGRLAGAADDVDTPSMDAPVDSPTIDPAHGTAPGATVRRIAAPSDWNVPQGETQ